MNILDRVSVDGYQNYSYEASEVSNYDGDSIRCTIGKTWDFGFHNYLEQSKRIAVRLKGVDTPELRDKDPQWKAAAYLAKEKVESWLADRKGNLIFLSLDKPDKYGRALGDFMDIEGHRLTDYLLENNLGVRYEGQSKDDIERAHSDNIQILVEDGLI